MKKLLYPLMIMVAATGVMPLTAAEAFPGHRWGYDHRDDGGDIYRRLDRIDIRIERNLRRGSITPREARRLRDRMNDIVRLERRYSWNGLDRREWRELTERVDRLERRFQRQRWDDDRW